MNKKIIVLSLLVGVLWLLLFLITEDWYSRGLILMVIGMSSLLYSSLDAERRKSRRKHEESERRALQAELNEKEQRLLVLENQINPHFLYNTLDTFRGMALESGNKKLSDMMESLSQMFQYSVRYEGEMVTVNDELNYLRRYIQIQQLRFPNRFEYHEYIECEEKHLLMQTCPRLILQPVVENAIRHGLKNMRKGGVINLFISYKKDYFSIIIEDNGEGMDSLQCALLNQRLSRMTAYSSETEFDYGRGIGIENVNRRVKLFCGEEYGLSYVSVSGGGIQVQISLPPYEEIKEYLKENML